MSNVDFSTEALAKIKEKWDLYTNMAGKVTIPQVSYYQRSFFRSNEGDVTELGPGLNLTFVDYKSLRYIDPILVLTKSHFSVVVVPATFFQSGIHLIDWAGDRLALRTNKT